MILYVSLGPLFKWISCRKVHTFIMCILMSYRWAEAGGGDL